MNNMAPTNTPPVPAPATPPKPIDLPNVLVVGPSGSGKTRSILNLLPEKTRIINNERKALPFRAASKFTRNLQVAHHQVMEQLVMFGGSPQEEICVLDSLMSLTDEVYYHCRKTFSGYEIFNKHNEIIRDIFKTIQNIKNKIVIVLDLDDLYNENNADGTMKSYRCARINGKELRAEIERNFEIVLFTEVQKQSNGTMLYQFLTNSDGICTAKSPEGMFPQKIANDLKVVVDGIRMYYQ